MKKSDQAAEVFTVTAEQFRQMLNVSPNTFKKLLENGDIPPPLPLGSRSRRWSRAIVLAFLKV
jgi:predicted DNA-binding transcriptional regulator AlpA